MAISTLDLLRPTPLPGMRTSTSVLPPPAVPKPPGSLFTVSGNPNNVLPNSTVPQGGGIKLPVDPQALGPDLTGNGPGVMLKVPAPTYGPAVPQVRQPTPTRPVAPAVAPKAAPVIPRAPGIDQPGGGFVDESKTADIAKMLAQVQAQSSQGQGGSRGAPEAPKPAADGSTPTPPASPAMKAVTDAEAAYQSIAGASPEELATQADLDRLIEATKKGYVGTEDQAIPLEFITGQMASIERRANALAEPLQTKLARMQAKRQASLEASKFALERADKKLEAERTAGNPTEVGGNLVKLNPDTGKYETVYQAPAKAAEGFTLGEGQKRYDAEGKLVAEGAEKPGDVRESGGYLYERQANGTWKQVAGSGPAGGNGKVVNINGTDYIQNADGTFSKPDVPETPASMEKIDALRGKVALIDSLLKSEGLAGSVGPFAITRFGTPFDQAARQEFAAGVNQLIGKETIDTLVNLKERGGTLGALSDQERLLLQTAASKIGSWMVRDKNGNPTGEFAVSEEDFKRELESIKALALKAIERAGGSGGQDELDAMLQSAGIPGFSNVPSTTQKGSAVAIAKAIRTVESGGNYSARGASGESGAYQFMPETWKQWASQYLGNPSAPMTRANQDKVALAHIETLLGKGYNPVQISLIWNGGQPIVKKGVNQYGVAYDSGAYARKVVKELKAQYV